MRPLCATMFWPDLPATIPVDLPGYSAELRLVGAHDAIAVENSVSEQDQAETFAFFTFLPFPIEEFIAEPDRRMYALWVEDRVIASTTVYNADADARTAMLGCTWVVPEFRGQSSRGSSVNTALKQAMYSALRAAGVGEVWFRADVENLRSCRSMEKNGAQRMHLDEEPRVYPELPNRAGRVSSSVFYRKFL